MYGFTYNEFPELHIETVYGHTAFPRSFVE